MALQARSVLTRVKTGDIVKVQVVEVDVARKRIALSMKLGAAPQNGGSAGMPRGRGGPPQAGDNRFEGAARHARGQASSRDMTPQSTAMASAFAKLKP